MSQTPNLPYLIFFIIDNNSEWMLGGRWWVSVCKPLKDRGTSTKIRQEIDLSVIGRKEPDKCQKGRKFR